METGTTGALRSGATPELEDLVADIAGHLQDASEYRLTLVPRPPQRLVDVRWAALRAGQLLGRRVRVVTSRAMSAGDNPITVRIISSPAHHGLIPRMREETDRPVS